MTSPIYRVVKWAPGYDLGAFDCGEPSYNEWLTLHAATSVQSGVCAVYLLLEAAGDRVRVMGYYAISPTEVVRAEVPPGMGRGWPRRIPAWRLGKLAVDLELRQDQEGQWGRQLLRDALETLVRVSDAGGGKVVVVDVDNPGLLDFYLRNGFRSAGVAGDLTVFLKMSTARTILAERRPPSGV